MLAVHAKRKQHIFTFGQATILPIRIKRVIDPPTSVGQSRVHWTSVRKVAVSNLAGPTLEITEEKTTSANGYFF